MISQGKHLAMIFTPRKEIIPKDFHIRLHTIMLFLIRNSKIPIAGAYLGPTLLTSKPKDSYRRGVFTRRLWDHLYLHRNPKIPIAGAYLGPTLLTSKPKDSYRRGVFTRRLWDHLYLHRNPKIPIAGAYLRGGFGTTLTYILEKQFLNLISSVSR